jgi:isocitrate dehydrogenase
VGTDEFASAVIERLGKISKTLGQAHYPRKRLNVTPAKPIHEPVQELVGVDVFVQARLKPHELAEQIKAVAIAPLELVMITNRGVQVWPQGAPETYCTDHWRCRIKAEADHVGELDNRQVLTLLNSLDLAGVDFVKTEHLYNFDGQPGFSMGQGQ